MSKYNTAINSSSYEYLKSLISDKVKIVDVKVMGKYLTAFLQSSANPYGACIKFSVLN